MRHMLADSWQNTETNKFHWRCLWNLLVSTLNIISSRLAAIKLTELKVCICTCSSTPKFQECGACVNSAVHIHIVRNNIFPQRVDHTTRGELKKRIPWPSQVQQEVVKKGHGVLMCYCFADRWGRGWDMDRGSRGLMTNVTFLEEGPPRIRCKTHWKQQQTPTLLCNKRHREVKCNH